jgi:hypothetical protein
MKLADLIDKKAGFLANIGAVIFDESTSIAAEDIQVVVADRRKYKSPDADPNAATLPDFGQAQTRFQKFVNRYSKLDGVHCIHTGHVRTDTTPNGSIQYSPSYGPKLGALIRQPMDLVSYLTVNEEGERVFRNHPMKGIVAKSRVKDLDPISDFKTLIDRTTAWLDSSKAEPEVQETIDPMDITQEMEI